MVEKEKMTNKQSIYLDEETFNMISQIAEEYGVKPTEVIRSALKAEDTFNRIIPR